MSLSCQERQERTNEALKLRPLEKKVGPLRVVVFWTEIQIMDHQVELRVCLRVITIRMDYFDVNFAGS